jgi:hypothetical protein
MKAAAISTGDKGWARATLAGETGETHARQQWSGPVRPVTAEERPSKKHREPASGQKTQAAIEMNYMASIH